MDTIAPRMLVVAHDGELRERLVTRLAPAVSYPTLDDVPTTLAFSGAVVEGDTAGTSVARARALGGLRDGAVVQLVARDAVAAALEAGADDAVGAPWNEDEIVARVRCAQERRAADGDGARGTDAAAGLQREVDYLAALVDASPEAIAATDMEGLVLLFNARAEQILGVSRDEVIRKRNVTTFLAAGMAKELRQRLNDAVGSGDARIEGLRTSALAAGDTTVPILLSCSAVLQGGTATGVVGIFSDLRERLRIEDRLHEAQQQIELSERHAVVAELAGTAAHELNQPLTSIMGYSEMLLRRLGRETPAGSLAETILHEVERMAEIVRKLGRMVRYETREYVGSAQILDLDRAAAPNPPDDGDPSRGTR